MSAELHTGTAGNTTPEQERLIEKMLERSNMMEAYKQVIGNKGSAGIDGMTVEDLKPFVQANWETIKGKLLSGTYQPKAVRLVEIPKPTRRVPATGDIDGSGPAHTAGYAPGAKADV